MREQCGKEQRDCWQRGKYFFFFTVHVFFMPFQPCSGRQGGWGGVEILLEWFHIRGLHILAPWWRASLEAPALFPKLSSRSPAWACCASFKWIYGPIKGESLCTIKSRTDLSGIQFNNYLSNSIIFRYVVSVSADLEGLLGAFDRQDSTFYCSVTNPAPHRPCTHLISASKLQKDCGGFVWAWTWRRMCKGLLPALSPVWGLLLRPIMKNFCLCADKWLI